MKKNCVLLFALFSLCVCSAFSQNAEFVSIENDVFVRGGAACSIKGAVLSDAIASYSDSRTSADSLMTSIDSLKAKGVNTLSISIEAESLRNDKFLDSFDSFCFRVEEKGLLLFISLDSKFVSEAQLEQLLLRVNKKTKLAYKDDASVFAWSIPYSESLAKMVKKIDKNHLVTYQSEDLQGSVLNDTYYSAFSSPSIDFIAIHLNPLKFRWIKNSAIQTDLMHSYSRTIQLIEKAQIFARKTMKPLVIESISFSEDADDISMSSNEIYRDAYFDFMTSYWEKNKMQSSKIAGLFFEYK